MIINPNNHHQHQELWNRTLALQGHVQRTTIKSVGGKANKCSGEKTEKTEQEAEVKRGKKKGRRNHSSECF